MDSAQIRITLTADGIERYCRELARSVSRPERRVVALDAVNTFIAAITEPGEQAKPEFAAIRETLGQYFERARGELQTVQARSLLAALRRRELACITPLYASLSRDAFWQLLVEAEKGLLEEERRGIADWSADWLHQVTQRSAQASPYPDMIDFKAAGVEVVEYTSMSDIQRFFTS